MERREFLQVAGGVSLVPLVPLCLGEKPNPTKCKHDWSLPKSEIKKRIAAGEEKRSYLFKNHDSRST